MMRDAQDRHSGHAKDAAAIDAAHVHHAPPVSTPINSPRGNEPGSGSLSPRLGGLGGQSAIIVKVAKRLSKNIQSFEKVLLVLQL
jgi:hypothetical protein